MKTKDLVLCALFASFICISALFTVPLFFTPIPITFQVMAVFITGTVLGGKYGAISVFIYIVIGFVGLPVYSGMRGGPNILFGPTGGYILGFIPAVFVIGVLTSKTVSRSGNNLLICFKLMVSMFIGLIVIYAIGTIQFMIVTHNSSIISSLMSTVILFIPLDIIKIIMAVFASHFLLKNDIFYYFSKNH